MSSATEDKHRLLFATTPDAVLILDAATGLVADANPALLALLGSTREKLLGRRLAEISGRAPAAAPNLRLIAEAIPEMISVARADGTVEFVNNQWLDYLGCSAREMRDMRWHRFTHQDDLAATLEACNRAASTGGVARFERRIQRRDGVYRWHVGKVRALVNGSQSPTMWVGVDTDIDDQKRVSASLETAIRDRTAELKQFVDQLETFSYTMAHELRGPLRTMQGYADILAEDYAARLDNPAREYLNHISAAAGRMHQLVTEVLVYTRPNPR